MIQPATVDASCRLLCVSPAEKILSAIPSWATTSVTSAFFNQSALIFVALLFLFFRGSGVALLCDINAAFFEF